MASGLHVRLDAPLPAELAVGAGSAVFVAGTCHAGALPVTGLELLVDGEPQPVMAHGMPRIEVLKEVGAREAYRSGFWATVAAVAAAGITGAVLLSADGAPRTGSIGELDVSDKNP